MEAGGAWMRWTPPEEARDLIRKDLGFARRVLNGTLQNG